MLEVLRCIKLLQALARENPLKSFVSEILSSKTMFWLQELDNPAQFSQY